MQIKNPFPKARPKGISKLKTRRHASLVSVIVPVYNSKDYLDKCISSVLASSYKEIELILVDDGSSDGSSELCDQWAKRDARVIVLHQKNGGTNAARNRGLDAAHGEFIGFVDDDDWVAPELFSVLLNHISVNNADLAITAASYVYPDDSVDSRNAANVQTVLNSELAFKYINLPGNFGPAPWDKVARACLFDGLRFPERDSGSSYEDYSLAFRLIDLADVIVYDSTPRYFYRQTVDSLSNSRSEINCSSMVATKTMIELVRKKYPSALPYARYGHLSVSLGTYDSVIASGMMRTGRGLMHEVEQLVRDERKEIRSIVQLSLARRVQLWMVAYVPWLYRSAFIIYKAIHPRRTE